ncbi:hypothetical protein ACWEKT_39135 [Nocardia takedensis]
MLSIRTRSAVSPLFTACLLAAAGPLANAAPAAAQPGGPFPTLWSLTQGPCVAQVDAVVDGDALPGRAAFTVITMMHGAAPVGDCALPVTLTWTEVNSGATGSYVTTAWGPGYWSNSGPAAVFAPGPGVYEASVAIGEAHTPESGAIRFTVGGR